MIAGIDKQVFHIQQHPYSGFPEQQVEKFDVAHLRIGEIEDVGNVFHDNGTGKWGLGDAQSCG